jgi:hypothetical protein
MGLLVNNELEKMYKEAFVALFKVLLRHLPGGIEESDNNGPVSVSGFRAES